MCEGRQQQKLKKKEKRGEGLSGSFMILFLTCLLFNYQPSLEFYLTFQLEGAPFVSDLCPSSFFCPKKSLMSLAHLKWRERENSEEKKEKRPFAFLRAISFLVFLLPFLLVRSVSLAVNQNTTLRQVIQSCAFLFLRLPFFS